MKLRKNSEVAEKEFRHVMNLMSGLFEHVSKVRHHHEMIRIGQSVRPRPISQSAVKALRHYPAGGYIVTNYLHREQAANVRHKM